MSILTADVEITASTVVSLPYVHRCVVAHAAVLQLKVIIIGNEPKQSVKNQG